VERIDHPPSRPSNLVLVSQDRRGHWVALEEHGLFGGLFVSRAQAVKYALFENGNHPEAIVLTNSILELDMARDGRPLFTA
jgi:hypothetical protein